MMKVSRRLMAYPQMRYSELGRTGITVSCIGLGCSPLGGGLFQGSDRLAADLIGYALDRGVSFFDTSNNYGMGRSEELIGRAVRGRRQDVVIATKGGAAFTHTARVALAMRPALRPLRALFRPFRRRLNLARDAHKRYDYSPASLRAALEGSLRRLGTDYVDIYQLYNPVRDAPQLGAAMDLLDRFKQEGKARCVGLAVNRVVDAAGIDESWPTDTIQLPLSLLDQEALRGFLGDASGRGIGIIARSVLGQGILTDGQGHLMADESSHYSPSELRLRRARREQLRALAVPGRTLAQAAVRFAIEQPGVSTALVAAVSTAELDEDIGALASPPFNAAELRTARQLADESNPARNEHGEKHHREQ